LTNLKSGQLFVELPDDPADRIFKWWQPAYLTIKRNTWDWLTAIALYQQFKDSTLLALQVWQERCGMVKPACLGACCCAGGLPGTTATTITESSSIRSMDGSNAARTLSTMRCMRASSSVVILILS